MNRRGSKLDGTLEGELRGVHRIQDSYSRICAAERFILHGYLYTVVRVYKMPYSIRSLVGVTSYHIISLFMIGREYRYENDYYVFHLYVKSNQ